jgi:6-phosphogluconolactonase
MKIEVFADADSVAREAAAIIAAEARASVAAHGRFIAAFSGGHTPWLMLRALADETVPWAGVHVAQVDERVAPAGDPDRNLTHLRESLLEHAPLRLEQIYAMPVELPDLEAAAKSYAVTLAEIAGSPPVLTLSTWDSDLTDTPAPWCLEILSSRLPTETLPSPESTREGVG